MNENKLNFFEELATNTTIIEKECYCLVRSLWVKNCKDTLYEVMSGKNLPYNMEDIQSDFKVALFEELENIELDSKVENTELFYYSEEFESIRFNAWRVTRQKLYNQNTKVYEGKFKNLSIDIFNEDTEEMDTVRLNDLESLATFTTCEDVYKSQEYKQIIKAIQADTKLTDKGKKLTIDIFNLRVQAFTYDEIQIKLGKCRQTICNYINELKRIGTPILRNGDYTTTKIERKTMLNCNK